MQIEHRRKLTSTGVQVQVPAVILNAAAGGGAALAKWGRIEPSIRSLLGDFSVHPTANAGAVEALIRELLEAGTTEFIAAGGDGTVNLLLNRLLSTATAEQVPHLVLGAVGLGSSNDFHKPIGRACLVEGVPCRLDFARARPHDVGVLSYTDSTEGPRARYWIINASVGTTAEANYRFNRPGPILRRLKARAPQFVIGCVALHAIVRCPSREMRLMSDGGTVRDVRVKNLGVVKNPHFTDGLRYDSPHEPASGRFDVHLVEHVSPARLLLILARLRQGRFAGQKGTRSWRVRRLRVRAESPFAVEVDGEVMLVPGEAEFSLHPQRLRVCSC
jgi:diacylglycerol kinase (ATP)